MRGMDGCAVGIDFLCVLFEVELVGYARFKDDGNSRDGEKDIFCSISRISTRYYVGTSRFYSPGQR